MGAMETIASILSGHGAAGHGRGGWLRAATAARRQLRAWAAVQRSRAELEELTDQQLRDIGITRHAAQREAARRPFYWV